MIDVYFDFTTDTPGYWEGFWTDSLGRSSKDPDACSPTLKEYHRLLWSKDLPNGQKMELVTGNARDYLKWDGIRFGSDSITATPRYARYRYMMDQVRERVKDFEGYYHGLQHSI